MTNNPHFHLTVLQSANLHIKVRMQLRGYTFGTWAKKHGITCDPKKLSNPQSWRISYGVFRRIAQALGTTPDKLYKAIQ